jgi:hypothetical protein
MSMKKLGVAAALILCAFGASASNFRGADQVYIPAAGNFLGASGRFISDVQLANLTNDEVDVSVIFQQLGLGGGTGQEFKNVIQLKAQERREIKNFIPTALGLNAGNEFGQLIFNGCLKGANCGPETQNEDGVSPNFRSISAESRVFLIPNGSGPNPLTTGQLFSGIPWYNFVSSLQAGQNLDKVFITGVRQTGGPGTPGTFRSNIGVINASQYSSTTIVLELYQGSLIAADKKAEATRDLGPLGGFQSGVDALFGAAASGEGFFVVVSQRNNIPTSDAPSTCTQGCPAFLAYGSVLDNGSGDATTLEAQYMKELPDDALVIIYPSGNTNKPAVRRSVRH